MMSRAFCPVFLLVVSWTRIWAADDVTAGELMAAMIRASETINDGSFSAKISETFVDTSGKLFTRPSEVVAVFDFSKSSIRWTFEQTRLVNRRNSAELNTLTQKQLDDLAHGRDRRGVSRQKIRFQMVRNADYMAEWYAIGERGSAAVSQLCLRPPDTTPNPYFSGYFDVRGGCFLWMPEFLDGIIHYTDVLQKWRTGSQSSVEQAGDLISVSYTRGPYRRRFLADPTKEMTCQRMEFVELDENGVEKELRCWSVTQWAHKDACWVPVQFQYNWKRKDGSVQAATCDISWQTINTGQYDPAQYHYASMDAVWDGTEITEWRFGAKGVPIGVVGDSPEPPTPPQQSKINPLWALATVIVLSVFSVLLARRFRGTAGAQ